MTRVSLIFPLTRSSQLQEGSVDRCRSGLEAAGHGVEVLAIVDPAEDFSPPNRSDGTGPGGSLRWLVAEGSGLASAAITGLTKATGDVRLVLDPTQGYLPEDLARTVAPILSREADLVVARRVYEPRTGEGSRLEILRTARGWAGRLTLRFLGATNPLAGLVAVSPELVEQIAGTYRPVGSRFVVDLLLRARGRRAEVGVRTEGDATPRALELDDIRHLKRLADDRFGNASRLLQFCAVGASGMVIDLSFYALFQKLLRTSSLASQTAPLIGSRLDLAASGALAILLALTWNFSLNRRLTFNDARASSILRQFVAYAMSNALGIALSFVLRLTLPAHVRFFDQHKLAAAVVGIVAATGISFSLARWVVFRQRIPLGVAEVIEATPARS